MKYFDGVEITYTGGIIMDASESQVKFFDKLLEEKDFGDQDVKNLKETFGQLNKKSASDWIEKALKLPKVDDSDEQAIAPPF
jgi:hypothetical protein